MHSTAINRNFAKKLTIIFAASYALAALIVFTGLFFLFVLGNSVQFQEPNIVIASVELASTVISAAILLIHLLDVTGIRDPQGFGHERGHSIKATFEPSA